MRILIAHNRYQFVAGEEAVVQAEQQLLQANGHDVSLLEVSNENIVGLWSKVKAIASATYSIASRSLIGAEIERFQPDIVHIHNFFPLLSPSVYDACDSARIPVVQTLHNYRLGCPGAKLLRDGKICEDCLGKPFPLPGVLHGCYRNSRAQTAVVASMFAIHQLRGTWQDRVNAYIALTAFQKTKMVKAGLPEAKIHVKSNFVFDPAVQKQPAGEYALFVGRLWEEKGIDTLIEAYTQSDLRVPLKIVGDGPLRSVLQEQVQAAGLAAVIEFMGWKEKQEVLALMSGAQFLIFPSIWYETFGLSIIEAYACGLPVLASRLGGMMELVKDGITGLHFEAGNALDLASKMHWASSHPAEMSRMGKGARHEYEVRYNPKENHHQLMKIYEQAIQENPRQLMKMYEQAIYQGDG